MYVVLHVETCTYVFDSEHSEEALDTYNDVTPGTSPMFIGGDLENYQDRVVEVSMYGELTDDEKQIDMVNLLSGSEEDGSSEVKSIVQWIKDSLGAGRLKKLLVLCDSPKQVQELPSVYDGTMCYELPTKDRKRK